MVTHFTSDLTLSEYHVIIVYFSLILHYKGVYGNKQGWLQKKYISFIKWKALMV